ncbi:phage recombination protein Bet [Auritidibacter ignavus]|uniref:phage recombination protein Bet n=1 Tax=Auritidibacter ignavus TaxID=678932 RepID=UPI000F03E416|nr:phage recombination protein Bet [Auritidibacter ignavus]NIH70514.1 phage recombination protein Bet [Auritidibacter ignavus]RMX23297.1 phage recombination protein Bet [Auritidibacter ignavus]
MTELQETTTTDLSIRQDQHGFNDMQVAALKQLGVQANNPADIQVFFHQAKATGLDPFKREIYMITRKGRPTIQTGIDGFYKIADRVSRATGGTWGITETLWCGQDGQWVDVWLQSGPPAAAKVTVERNGAKFTTVAVFSEYQAEGPLWQKMPARMIAKCAEALAIRKAFPDSLSGLYTSEEMEQADNPASHHSHRRVAQPARGGGQLAPPDQSEAPGQGIDWEDALSTATSQPEVAHLVSLMKQDGVPSDDPAMRVARDVWRNLPAQAPEDTGEIVEQEG